MVQQQNDHQRVEQPYALFSQPGELVPNILRVKKVGKIIGICYAWDDEKKDRDKKIKKILYNENEQLGDLFTVSINNFVGTICRNNRRYIVRRLNIPKSIKSLRKLSKIDQLFEKVIGYFTTCSNERYLISKVEEEAKVFDRRIAEKGLPLVKIEMFSDLEKLHLTEKLMSELAELHEKNISIGRLTPERVVIIGKDIGILDPIQINIHHSDGFAIDEVVGALRAFMTDGMFKKGDAMHAAAVYVANKKRELAKEMYKRILDRVFA